MRDRCVIVYRDASAGDYRSEYEVSSGTIAPSTFADVVIPISQFLD